MLGIHRHSNDNIENIGHNIEKWLRGVNQFLYNTQTSKILGILENNGLKGISHISKY